MADDDVYSPAYTEDDEDLLKQQGEYAPADPSGSMSAAAAQPLETPAMPDPRALPVTSNTPGTGPSLSVEPRAPRPQWSDYAPPEPHGWAKAGHIAASLWGPTNYAFNELPQQRAEAKYKNAVSEYEAPEREAYQESETAKNQAEAAKDLRPPIPPEVYSDVPGVLGPNDQPMVLNKTTGKVEPANVPGGAHPIKPPADTQTQNKENFQGIVSKVAAAGLSTDPAKLDASLDAAMKAGTISRQEFANAHAYLAANPTPSTTVQVHQADQTPDWTLAEDGQGNPVLYNPKTGQTKPANNVQKSGTHAKQSAELDKKTTPIQGVLDEIAEAKDYAATPSATNDYGLLMNFIGVTKPESLAKLRLNQNEVSLATRTRGTLGDLEALRNKVENGEMLTADQRKSMIDTMLIVEKYAQRQMDRVKGGGEPARFTEGGKTYNIPANKVEDFKKDHPHATPAQ